MTIIARPLVICFLLAMLFSACQQKTETPGISQTELSKQLIDEHFKYLNDRNLKALVDQYSDKAKIVTIHWNGEAHGKQGADQVFHELFYVSPDAKYLVDNIINNDSTLVVEYDVIGLKEKSGSVVRYDIRSCSIFKIKDNKIISEATYSNPRLYGSKKD